MMRFVRVLSLVGAVSIVGTAGFSPASEQPVNEQPVKKWHTSFESAQAEAKRLDVPLLLHFYADWCLPCRRMEKEILKDPALLKQFGDRIVAVKINSDRHQDLVERYSVRALPADVFVHPDGRLLARIESHQGKASYLAQIAKVEASFTSSAKARVTANQPSRVLPDATTNDQPNDQPNVVRNDGANVQSATAGPPASSGEKKADAEKADASSIGLKGYSPVSLSQHRKWRKGKPKFTVTHKEIVYHLADADEYAAFRADPHRYAPRLLGCDPVLLWETDRAIAGSIRYGAYFDGELYLFSTRENRSQFKKAPNRYTQSRHVLRADRIERTMIR